MKTAGRVLVAALVGCVLVPASARAQVVISAGIQEIYDDNIFLENTNGTPPPIVIDDQLSNPELEVINPPKQVNGDPDDDFITNPYVAFSGAIPLTPHLKTSAEGKVGALLFANESDESRLTLDMVITSDAEKSLLGDPYYAGTKIAIQSRSADITAAEGTASEQAQTLIADLHFGLRDIQLATDTKMGLGYIFAYNDFLGDFTFGNDSEDLGVYEDRIDVKGSDYFTNGLDFTVNHDFTQSWSGGYYAGVTDYVFTNVETNDNSENTDSDLDRVEGITGLKTSYQISEQVSVGGNAGINLTHFKNEQEDETITILNGDGTTNSVLVAGDQDETSFLFGANANYAPDTATLLRLAVDQSQRTDIDGDHIITRTLTLDASKGLGDRLKLAAGGRFLQFNVGDSIDNPTERWEVTLSTQYSLTESLAISFGWNYVDQDADDSNLDQQLLYSSEDYSGNRFFIGLSGGLVGS